MQCKCTLYYFWMHTYPTNVRLHHHVRTYEVVTWHDECWGLNDGVGEKSVLLEYDAASLSRQAFPDISMEHTAWLDLIRWRQSVPLKWWEQIVRWYGVTPHNNRIPIHLVFSKHSAIHTIKLISKLYSLHIIVHNSGTFRSILIIFSELLNSNKVYIITWIIKYIKMCA